MRRALSNRLYLTPGKRVLGVDPGHRSTRVVELIAPRDKLGKQLPLEPSKPHPTRVWNYSRAQRRHEAKAARTARRYASWNSFAAAEHAALACVTHRTANTETFDRQFRGVGCDAPSAERCIGVK